MLPTQPLKLCSTDAPLSECPNPQEKEETVKYLLDTGVWLWSVWEPERISRKAREVMADFSHEVFLSAVTSWEVAIKAASGKLELPEPPGLVCSATHGGPGSASAGCVSQHALAVFALPAHHRDPFDRLLIAQAKVEEMTLITADRMFDRYPVKYSGLAVQCYKKPPHRAASKLLQKQLSGVALRRGSLPRFIITASINGWAFGSHGTQIGGKLSAVVDAVIVNEAEIEDDGQSERAIKVYRGKQLFGRHCAYPLDGAQIVLLIPGNEFRRWS